MAGNSTAMAWPFQTTPWQGSAIPDDAMAKHRKAKAKQGVQMRGEGLAAVAW